MDLPAEIARREVRLKALIEMPFKYSQGSNSESVLET
jgi:hypothetical protein